MQHIIHAKTCTRPLLFKDVTCTKPCCFSTKTNTEKPIPGCCWCMPLTCLCAVVPINAFHACSRGCQNNSIHPWSFANYVRVRRKETLGTMYDFIIRGPDLKAPSRSAGQAFMNHFYMAPNVFFSFFTHFPAKTMGGQDYNWTSRSPVQENASTHPRVPKHSSMDGVSATAS